MARFRFVSVPACALVTCFALAACFATPALSVEVSLTVADSANVARKAEVVTTGVPFAKGAVKDVSALCARVKGRAVPAQFIRTVPWPDGSVRWALMDVQVDVAARGRTRVVVSSKGRNPAPARRVTVRRAADALIVSTGPLEFVVSKRKFNLFRSVTVDGRRMITGGRGLVVYKAGGGEVTAGRPSEVKLEQAGPMRAIICVKGTFPGVHRNLLRYTTRITAYAGKKFVKVHTWLENEGNYGYTGTAEWLNFDGMSVELGLGLGANVTAACEGVTGRNNFRVEQLNPGHRYRTFQYKISSGRRTVKTGVRTDGIVALSGRAGKLTVAVRHFWQNYEKAIELAGAKSLRIWLWPRNGEWPRSTVRRGASCGEFRQFRKRGLYALAGGVSKGHEFILDFSGRSAASSAATLNTPLMAQATAEYYASTEAAPGWFAPAGFATGVRAYDQRVRNWNRMAHNAIDPSERSSLIRTRQGPGEGRGFWFGWMDFGDLYWQPGASSLHYDWTWVMLLNYMRQGDRGFLDMGSEMALHRIDIDQVWSDRTAYYFRGLTHYEKQYTDIHGGVRDGHYKPIPSHNWISGVVLYYMLTGSPRARECALRNAMGIRLRQVNRFRNQASAGGQLRSTGWSILALCSVYDMTADRQYLNDAMILFNNNIVPKWRARGPFMDGGLQYYYSVQGLTELHHRTGNANILRLLREGCQGNFTHRYAEWQIHLSSLYAYVGHVTRNAQYITRAQQLFNAYAPGQANPPCYTGTGAWTKETCKMIRNGHILQYVMWRMRN